MTSLLRFATSDLTPRPADPTAARIALDRWRERAADLDNAGEQEAALALVEDPEAGPLLRTVFGSSPFLTECLLAEMPFALALSERGPEVGLAEALAAIPPLGREADQAALMVGLRRARRKAALAIALADIAGQWPVEKVTRGISDLAEAALQATVDHLLRRLRASGKVPIPDCEPPSEGCGFFVLAMGKLGSRELNYSSDIDLMVFYDETMPGFAEIDDLQQRFVRVVRDMVKILSERTAEGYVFRTDLRLRPDPGATPVAMSVGAAEVYYESLGQNWERAAMIKGRPVAGDLAAGKRFLKHLKPFVWRKHLDFAAIRDIHSIKRQIHAAKGGADIAVAGHNLKLGRGGIREIEFFAQTQQLIWGGRNPTLRVRPTIEAMEALVALGRVEREVCDDLADAYRTLRKVEHRLQMVADEQTQTLPEDETHLARLAAFLGYADTAAFAEAITGVLKRVERRYARLFEEAPSLSGPGNLVFTGTEDDPGTIETLTKLGYRDASMVCATVRGWHHGRYRATRSERARQILTELMPALLEALAKTSDADGAFLRFDAFLKALPAGVQVFSLLHQNPRLLALLSEVMGSAPHLAEALGAQPNRLEAVLVPGTMAAPPGLDALKSELDRALEDADGYEAVLDLTRRWAEDRKFALGYHVLSGESDADRLAPAITDIAEAVVDRLTERAGQLLVEVHGRVPEAGMAVLALGKLGSAEMNIGSDLDMIFVYDVPIDLESDGPKPLQAGLYFGRWSQRLISGLTVRTAEGTLYEVDMRLRPSGNKGPIASNLDGFVRYQMTEAWTWEHMALTRARPIAGPRPLMEAAAAAVRKILTSPRDPEKLLADVADMRRRMAKEHPETSPWKVKHRPGGMVDIEFMAQYLQLLHAPRTPEVLAANTTDAIGRLAGAGALDRTDADRLIEAMRLWRRLQGFLRVTTGGDFDPATASEGVRRALVKAGGAADLDALATKVEATARWVREFYRRIIDAPAELLKRKETTA
ncbi:MAG: bifunctional [glutamine synthetase] adenylyltransferase/[glutamine synthetase]-adenylyl-L-tyrosine phosphorylase [Alphaproteobacteria bacterium]|nr:bifunctional [glutamine synthetase] adenylyltransferase/[glutamine synthetase]-adenylyl-L-tyrosine phosphorylase [Alphaproteobacteria bacterium]